MGIEMVLDMATSVVPDRVAIGRRESGLTYAQLDEVASGGASVLKERGAEHLVFVGVNGPSFRSSRSRRQKQESRSRP